MKILADTHSHTLASGHAYSTITEMAEAAAAKGLEVLALTEHAPKMPGTCGMFYFQNLDVVPRMQKGVRLLMGAEVNIMDPDGTIDIPEDTCRDLDIVVASIHPPCYGLGHTAEENTRAYVEVMKKPYIHIIGHPDDGRYPVDYDTLVAAAKEHHVLLELNNSSLNPAGSRVNPVPNDREMLGFCLKYGAPIIINSDSHCAADVGNHQYADRLLDEMDFPEHLIVNRSVEEYKKYINRFTLLK